MDYKYLNMETYKRKSHFEYFNGLAYPYVGVTVNVDITDLLKAIKAKKLVALSDGTYRYCDLDSNCSFENYISYAVNEQEKAKQRNSINEETDDVLGKIFISTIPWISYTALINPTPVPADSNPRITWGKYFVQNNKVLLPVSVLCHHALVDGLHISEFYDFLNEEMSIVAR